MTVERRAYTENAAAQETAYWYCRKHDIRVDDLDIGQILQVAAPIILQDRRRQHWLEADVLPRCQHCPNLADERSFMCEDCAAVADEEVQTLRDQNERLRGLWRDEALVTRLFEAHMRGDLADALRTALGADERG